MFFIFQMICSQLFVIVALMVFRRIYLEKGVLLRSDFPGSCFLIPVSLRLCSALPDAIFIRKRAWTKNHLIRPPGKRKLLP